MEKEKNQKLVIDGNAFYEIDLDCMEEKKKNFRRSPKSHFRKNASRI